MVESQILTQAIGKERHSQIRGLGLGPTPTSYYENSSSHSTTASTAHACRVHRSIPSNGAEIPKDGRKSVT